MEKEEGRMEIRGCEGEKGGSKVRMDQGRVEDGRREEREEGEWRMRARGKERLGKGRA